LIGQGGGGAKKNGGGKNKSSVHQDVVIVHNRGVINKIENKKEKMGTNSQSRKTEGTGLVTNPSETEKETGRVGEDWKGILGSPEGDGKNVP